MEILITKHTKSKDLRQKLKNCKRGRLSEIYIKTKSEISQKDNVTKSISDFSKTCHIELEMSI